MFYKKLYFIELKLIPFKTYYQYYGCIMIIGTTLKYFDVDTLLLRKTIII